MANLQGIRFPGHSLSYTDRGTRIQVPIASLWKAVSDHGGYYEVMRMFNNLSWCINLTFGLLWYVCLLSITQHSVPSCVQMSHAFVAQVTRKQSWRKVGEACEIEVGREPAKLRDMFKEWLLPIYPFSDGEQMYDLAGESACIHHTSVQEALAPCNPTIQPRT